MVVNTIVEDLGFVFRGSSNEETCLTGPFLRVANIRYNNTLVPLTMRITKDPTNTITNPFAANVTFRQAVAPSGRPPSIPNLYP